MASPTPVIIPWAGGVPYGEQSKNLNAFMTNQALQQYNTNLPGYANMVGQRSQNTQQMLEGKLPQDVINQIGQQSAERGIAGGQPGSPNANAAYLRALGLNSLQMMGSGSEELSKSITDTPVAELFNPSQLWVPSVLGQQSQEAAYYGRNQPSLTAREDAASAWQAARAKSMPTTMNIGRPWYSFL